MQKSDLAPRLPVLQNSLSPCQTLSDGSHAARRRSSGIWDGFLRAAVQLLCGESRFLPPQRSQLPARVATAKSRLIPSQRFPAADRRRPAKLSPALPVNRLAKSAGASRRRPRKVSSADPAFVLLLLESRTGLCYRVSWPEPGPRGRPDAVSKSLQRRGFDWSALPVLDAQSPH